MNFVKCIPFVGTAVSGYECVNALVHGDVKGFFCKGAETVIDGALDASIIITGGLSGLVTAPIKTAGKKGAILAGSAVVKTVAGRAFAGAVIDNINPARDNAEYYEPLFDQSNSGSDRKHQSSSPQQQSPTNSSNNARSTTTEQTHSGASEVAHGLSGDDDPSKRINHIKKTCQQPIRLIRARYYQKKAAASFPENFDPEVKTVEEANQRLMERMLHFVEVMHHRNFGNLPVPEAAIRRIFETIRESYALNNFYEWNRDFMVVQVDEIFSGIKADKTQWSVKFIIDADIPPPGSRQTPHFGITIARESQSFRTVNHAFVTNQIPYGRPRPDENELLTDSFVAKESETSIDGGSFKHEVIVTMLKKKPSPP